MKLSLIGLVISMFFAREVVAWGATGHRATGYIAEQYLKPRVKKKLAQVLQGESLAMVSTWMDEIRSDSLYTFTEDWHWTTIPDGQRYEDAEKNTLDGKAIQQLERMVRELKSGKLDAKTEREYIKFLVHLVGDLHQPLHVGRPGDRGGNDVKVKWAGRDSNLHRVWDSDMIDDTRLSYTELANSFVKPDAVTLANWQRASIRDWAHESMTFRAQVYDIGNGSLGYRYSYRNFSTAKLRLLQAGVRIAALLNDIYG